jgi:hypothetical protein
MHIFGVLLLLGMISSCGKSDSNAGLPIVREKALPINGSNINGLYMAKFFTINPGVNGTLPGSATIQRQDDELIAYVRLFGGGVSTLHQQGIYDGKRCPNAGDDLNKDGFIDMEEGSKVWGRLLIPLDSNINSQLAGKNVYPLGDATGTYFYERVASFNRLFKDLKSEDHNLADDYAKLAPDQGLAIEGRVVVVQGSADTVIYPATFAVQGRHTAAQSAPIACGVFSRVTKIPGRVEDGSIPGPVGQPGEGDDDWTTTDLPDEGTTPTPAPGSDDDYDSGRDNDDHDDNWYDRLRDWWRRRWNHDRGDHDTGWGNDGDD